jgi:hypothetical protein
VWSYSSPKLLNFQEKSASLIFMGKLTMTRKGGRGRLSHKGKWESAGKRGHKEEGVRRPKENKGCVTLWPCHLHKKKVS